MTAGSKAIFLATMAATVPLSAQDRAPPPPAASPADDPVVVTARQVTDVARVRALARRITPDATFERPIARFADPVCFAVAGMPDRLLVEVANRMVDDARQAGMRLGGTGCAPNVVVLFVDDGHAEIVRLRSKPSALLGALDLAGERRAVREPGPVHAVVTIATRSRDGDPLHFDGVSGPPVLQVPSASRIDLPTRRDIQRSVLLVDRRAVVGLSPVQIADYAAMRTLATVDPGGTSGADTILKLFDPAVGEKPAEATVFDRGYLRGLYQGAANHRGVVKVDEIAREISRGDAR